MEDLTAREQRLRRREQTILEWEQRERLRETELEQHANLRRERERIDREIEELEVETRTSGFVNGGERFFERVAKKKAVHGAPVKTV